MLPTPELLNTLARVIQRAEPGQTARVRRQPPTPQHHGAAFDAQTLLLQAGIDPESSADFSDWALVAHCLALCGGQHNPGPSAGEQLAALKFSEARMRLFVEADRTLLFDLLPRLARRAAGGAAMNWWQLSKPLLLARAKPDEAEAARRHLVAGYLRANSASTHN